MDYRTVGLVAGYQGRRPASGWLPQILREFASITRSGAPHPQRWPHEAGARPSSRRQVGGRTTPLARERRNLRSESDVFYRRLFRRIAPRAGQSARHARILDRGGRSGAPPKAMPKCTVKHVTFATLDANSSIVLEIPTEKRQTARED